MKQYSSHSFDNNDPDDHTINVGGIGKVIIEKSRGEGSLIGQDTIENVSEPKFFFNFLRKKKCFF